MNKKIIKIKNAKTTINNCKFNQYFTKITYKNAKLLYQGEKSWAQNSKK